MNPGGELQGRVRGSEHASGVLIGVPYRLIYVWSCKFECRASQSFPVICQHQGGTIVCTHVTLS